MRRSAVAHDVQVAMFDLDGTLIDTMGGFADVAAAVMAELHGIDVTEGRRRYLETSGIPFRQQLEVIAPGHALNDSASAVFEHKKRVHADSANLDPATLAALHKLRDCGLSLVVSSNSAQHFVDDFAARQSIQFDLVLGFVDGIGDIKPFAKGRPHVRHACKTLGVEPKHILFCGDSLKDGELARESGLAFIGRLGTFTREDFRRADANALVVEDVAALAALVAQRAAA